MNIVRVQNYIMRIVSLQSMHICLILLLYVFCCSLSLAEGQDFTLSRSEITFDAGANDGNSITVFVDVLDDLLVEGTECFTLSESISTATAPGASFVGGPATVCILDNEGKTVSVVVFSVQKLISFCGLPTIQFLDSTSSFDYFLQSINWMVGRAGMEATHCMQLQDFKITV